MAEFISILLAIAVAIMGYILWDHSQDAREARAESKQFQRDLVESQRQAISQLVNAQKENVQAQREMNCLISLPQEERRKEFLGDNSFCKRISR